MKSDATALAMPVGGLVVVAGGVVAWRRWKGRNTREDQIKNQQLPPLVSGGSWLLGHTSELIRADRFDVIERWAKQYGPTFRISLPVWYRCGFLGLERAYGVIVLSKGDQLSVMGSATFEKNITNSRLGPHWHDFTVQDNPRKKLMLAMSVKSLKNMVPAVFACAANLCETISGKDTNTVSIDLEGEMKRVALDMVGKACMTDFDMGAVSRDGPGHSIMEDLQPSQDDHAAMPYQLKCLNHYRCFNFLHSLTLAGRAVALSNGRVDDLAKDVLAHHDCQVACGKYDANRDGFNLAESCAAMARSGYSQENCVYDLGTYILTSNDIGERIGTCLHMLASQPQLQVALRREVEDALVSEGVDNDDVAKADPALFFGNHPHLPLLNAVIRETLRFWVAPVELSLKKLRLQISGGWTWRECVRDGAVLGGFSVPRGWHACASIYNAHRDIAAWGADAHEFRPLRWLDEVVGTADTCSKTSWVLKSEHELPALFSPFGHGSRACPAQKFGFLAMRVALATCILRWDLAPMSRNEETRSTSESPLELRCLVSSRCRLPTASPVASSAAEDDPEINTLGLPEDIKSPTSSDSTEILSNDNEEGSQASHSALSDLDAGESD
jgi:cytochrome P450